MIGIPEDISEFFYGDRFGLLHEHGTFQKRIRSVGDQLLKWVDCIYVLASFPAASVTREQHKEREDPYKP
jgi:hypothetical protein